MLMEDSLTRWLHMLSCAWSQTTRLHGKLLLTTHPQPMGNGLQYQFASLETSLKHFRRSKWKICRQYSFKRGGQQAVLKILRSLYHKSEAVSHIIPYQFQHMPRHFAQENIIHRHRITVSSCQRSLCCSFANTALNNCYVLACI